MNWVTTKRIFRAGFLDFWRNGFVSFASILMMTFTLFTIGLAIFTGVILQTTIQQFREKADMNVTFVVNAPEESILSLKKSIDALPEVSTTKYLNAQEQLDKFKDFHRNDQLTLQSIELVGNPFGGQILIEAKDISQYDAIAEFLKGQAALTSGSSQIIDKINYFDPKVHEALVNLEAVTASAQPIGFAVILLFVLTTIAISFNTLRLAIYTSREEIAVMRLVGAGQGYIRSPFLVEGVMYGLVAGLITMLLFYPLTWWLGSSTERFFGGINVFSYYITHFPMLFLVIVGSGVLIGLVASFLAVRRYLKI